MVDFNNDITCLYSHKQNVTHQDYYNMRTDINTHTICIYECILASCEPPSLQSTNVTDIY